MGTTLRFASGTPEAAWSGVWRLVVNGDDVYLGDSGMGTVKVSLHASGVWTLAATRQSGAVFERGNRRAMTWRRPAEHAPGVIRGPAIVIPNTTLGTRPMPSRELRKRVEWFPGPAIGHAVEFSLYLVTRDARVEWHAGPTVIGERAMANGGRVIVLAESRPMPRPFEVTVEKLLRENIVRMQDPSELKGGAFHWYAESRDELRIPMIVDLPVPVAPETPPVILSELAPTPLRH